MSPPGELPPLGPPEGRRPVFVRYDKEEPEDVEISLESDSDDSVVIVPPGMLILEGQDPASTQPLQPPPGAPVLGLVAVGTGSDTGAVNSPLPNELPTTMALPSNSSAVTTFPGQSQTPLVSLVPPLNPAAQLTTPSVGLGDTLPGNQLQQMLLQSSPAGQASQLGLMQLQTQMAQSSRQLQQTQQQQTQQPIASEEDLTVININSSDEDEDEEEEMDEDDIGEEEEEEEEEPLDDDDEEEEEEVSDFPDYYDGEEFADYEEEEEDMIEEEEGIIEGEEEDDELPQLEGESRSVLLGEEEGEALMGPVSESALGMFSGEDGDERDEPSGELEGPTAVYRKEGVQDEVKQTEEGDVGIIEEKLHKELEEEAKEGATSLEFQTGRQPPMTARETSQEAELESLEAEDESRQEVSLPEQGSTEEGEASAVSETAVLLEEQVTESAQEARGTEDAAGEEAVVELPLVEHEESKEKQTSSEEEAVAVRQSKVSGLLESEEVRQEESDNNSDDSRGMKRKREKGEIGEGEQSVEKKKVRCFRFVGHKLGIIVSLAAL